jgi:hypothetical protein
VSSIPLSFREQDLVEVAEGELWGSDFLFLIEKEELTFSDAFQLNTRFRKASNLQPLFVLKGLNRSLNRLLMDANIAFVTADGFAYIPSVLIAGSIASFLLVKKKERLTKTITVMTYLPTLLLRSERMGLVS